MVSVAARPITGRGGVSLKQGGRVTPQLFKDRDRFAKISPQGLDTIRFEQHQFSRPRIGHTRQVDGHQSQIGPLDLESDVAGSNEAPVYILHIEGRSAAGIESVRKALAEQVAPDIQVEVRTIETLIG